MKTNEYDIPPEVRSNRVEDLFKPCWIVRPLHSDSVKSTNEEGWLAMVVFEDTAEMLEMIGDWGKERLQPGSVRPVMSAQPL